MKINRINLEIPTYANKHRPYLYNEMQNLSREYKFGGQFGNDYITLQEMPENLLKVLEDLKIKYRKLFT